MRIIFTFWAITIAINLFGQTRVDGQREYTILASSPVVSKFVGWSYDSSKEKWAGYYNTLWDTYRGNNKVPTRTSAANMSKHDNIVSLQVKKILYKEHVFYAIIYTSWTGYFDYPTLMEGWHPYKHHRLLVFDEIEYMKVFSLKIGDDPTTIETFGNTFEYIPEEKSVTGLLNEYFNGNDINKRKVGQIYLKFKQEDNKTIRFAGPTPFMNWLEHFTKEYYEISIDTFNTLFIK